MKKSKLKKEKSDYDDCDCLVCKAMKYAEETGRFPGPQELKEVLKMAEKKGAIIGGSLIDEERRV